MSKTNVFALFGILFLSSVLLGNGMYSGQVFALENQTGTENEAEIEADIEQENKCKKDSDCDNENEINNTLNITTITSTGQQEESSTLNVTKTLTCSTSGLYPEFCENLGPEDVLITVTGNNPNPDEFPGSSEGTLVTLGAGDYRVNESFNISPGEGSFGVIATFSEDCTQVGPTQSEGTIAEGEAQTCIIDNAFYWIPP